MISAAAAASSAPVTEASSAIERCSRCGRSTHSAVQAATQNSAKQISKSTIARPNAVTRYSGTSAPRSNTERSESLAIEKSRYTGIAISPTIENATHATDTARRFVPSTRRISGRAISDPQREQADRDHHRQEHHPARDQQLRRLRARRDLGHWELRRGPRVGTDGVRERALHRMAVDRDRAPVDQVPALRQMRAQRHDERVGIGGRPLDRTGRHLVARGVGHRDDREPRLDRLVVGELHRRGRGLQHAAGRGHGPDQVGVRRGDAGQRQSGHDRRPTTTMSARTRLMPAAGPLRYRRDRARPGRSRPPPARARRRSARRS